MPAAPDQGRLGPQGLRPPIPLRASDGKAHLAYQLTTQNAGPVPVKVGRIAVLDADDGDKVIASFSGRL